MSVSKAKTRRRLFYSAVIIALAMLAFGEIYSAIRFRRVFLIMPYLEILANRAFVALIWSMALVWIGRRFGGSLRFVWIAALTAPITYRFLATLITDLVLLPLSVVLRGSRAAFRGIPLDRIFDGFIFRQYWMLPITTIVMVLFTASLLYCASAYFRIFDAEEPGATEKLTTSNQAAGLFRDPDTTVLPAAVLSCVANPVTLFSFGVLLVMADGRDTLGIGRAGSTTAIGVLAAYLVAYAVFYSWLGPRVSNFWIMLAKGLVVAVGFFPVAVLCGAALTSLIRFGSVSDGVAFLAFFAGAFGGLPILAASLVGILITRFFVYGWKDGSDKSADPSDSEAVSVS
ncbi:hypothetical protein WNY37_15855 [Henriciella sp. AS95]|uniref:hypothetical protein n=1 Tax=Henriciella sp. AS95 TaxID=3135782 RepID=UPI00316D37B0